jgi:hypothetical protein
VSVLYVCVCLYMCVDACTIDRRPTTTEPVPVGANLIPLDVPLQVVVRPRVQVVRVDHAPLHGKGHGEGPHAREYVPCVVLCVYIWLIN